MKRIVFVQLPFELSNHPILLKLCDLIMEKVRPIKTESLFWSPNLPAEINAMQRTKPLTKSSFLNMIYVATVEGHHTDLTN